MELAIVVAVVVVFCGVCVGCAHTVKVTANTDDAAVRVDGVPIGTVGEGASFTEEWGTSRVYDVEARAPGHHVARLQVKPTVVDVLGAPAMVSAVGGCGVSSCVLPFSLLVLYDYNQNPDDIVPKIPEGKPNAGDVDRVAAAYSIAGWVAALGVFGCTAASIWAATGSQRLPDEIHIELEPESGVVDTGLPPPPREAPLEPTNSTETPTTDPTAPQ